MKLFRKNRSITIEERAMEIYAPIQGVIKPLKEVEDMVFSSGMMGDGIAIEPNDGNLYSPISGKVSVVFPTGHVIGIEGKDDLNIILHVGIDTVELKGEGFQPLVKVGEVIRAGDRIMKFDLKRIQKAYCATIMLVVENSIEFRLQKKEMGEIAAGESIIQVERV